MQDFRDHPISSASSIWQNMTERWRRDGEPACGTHIAGKVGPGWLFTNCLTVGCASRQAF